MINPIHEFKDSWAQAKSINDGNAPYCTLATVSNSGQASTRTLVLREVTEDAFVIFINNTSPKWQDFSHSHQVEMLIFWPSLMKQYRIRGTLEPVPSEIMERHWAKKPYDSKILDHYYAEYQSQSSVLNSRDTLLSAINNLKQRHPKGSDIPYPDNAAGMQLKANYIESWQGDDENRLHQRYLYTLTNKNWERSVLVP